MVQWELVTTWWMLIPVLVIHNGRALIVKLMHVRIINVFMDIVMQEQMLSIYATVIQAGEVKNVIP